MAEGGVERRLKLQHSREDELGKPDTPAAGYSWESFSHWVSCVCVVTFDLELGQAMEVGIMVERGKVC